LFGHGTGSTKQLFDREAVGKTGAWADSISNPHNQTLYVAVQWGVLGCVVLYAMWYFHLLLFRERSFAAWIGLVVVVQNIVSSLLNSHLFDFHEGWMYVLGVGVAGGVVARTKKVSEPILRAIRRPPARRNGRLRPSIAADAIYQLSLCFRRFSRQGGLLKDLVRKSYGGYVPKQEQQACAVRQQHRR